MVKFPVTWSSKLNSAEFHFSRRLAFGAGAAFSVVCGSAVIVANTVGLSCCRWYLQEKRNDVPLVPSPELRNLAENAMTDLQLSKSEASSVDIFCSSLATSDVFGSINSTYGALIGLPSFLLAKRTDDVEFNHRFDQSFSVEEKEIELTKYKENSVMSDSAKRYIITEGLVLSRNSNHYLIPASLASFGTALTLAGTAYYIRKLNLYRYAFLSRNALYFVTCMFFGMSSVSLLNKVNEFHFKDIVSRLDENYIDAGIEYYGKLLARNAVLDGCYNSFFDVLDHWMLEAYATVRLEILKKRKQEFSQNLVRE